MQNTLILAVLLLALVFIGLSIKLFFGKKPTLHSTCCKDNSPKTKDTPSSCGCDCHH